MEALTIPVIELRLLAAFGGSLPGLEAHHRLAPVPRAPWPAGTSADAPRMAAALLLLYPLPNGDVALPLTVRSEGLARHSGQVSLPGGVLDDGETVEQAALREAGEEVGLDPRLIRILGQLTPIAIPVSGFLLHPIVGVAEERPDFQPAVGEVDHILEVPLVDFGDPARLHRGQRVRDGLPIEYAYFDLSGHQVWGATAMVLAELLVALGVRLEIEKGTLGGTT